MEQSPWRLTVAQTVKKFPAFKFTFQENPIKQDETGGACIMHGQYEKRIQNFSLKT
jgi:hypothetical protein